MDICHGVALEFAPIDGCPNSKIKQYIQLFHAFNYALFNTQRLPNNKGGFFRIAAKVIYKLVPSPHVRYLLWKHEMCIRDRCTTSHTFSFLQDNKNEGLSNRYILDHVPLLFYQYSVSYTHLVSVCGIEARNSAHIFLLSFRNSLTPCIMFIVLIIRLLVLF